MKTQTEILRALIEVELGEIERDMMSFQELFSKNYEDFFVRGAAPMFIENKKRLFWNGVLKTIDRLKPEELSGYLSGIKQSFENAILSKTIEQGHSNQMCNLAEILELKFKRYVRKEMEYLIFQIEVKREGHHE